MICDDKEYAYKVTLFGESMISAREVREDGDVTYRPVLTGGAHEANALPFLVYLFLHIGEKSRESISKDALNGSSRVTFSRAYAHIRDMFPSWVPHELSKKSQRFPFTPSDVCVDVVQFKVSVPSPKNAVLDDKTVSTLCVAINAYQEPVAPYLWEDDTVWLQTARYHLRKTCVSAYKMLFMHYAGAGEIGQLELLLDKAHGKFVDMPKWRTARSYPNEIDPQYIKQEGEVHVPAEIFAEAHNQRTLYKNQIDQKSIYHSIASKIPTGHLLALPLPAAYEPDTGYAMYTQGEDIALYSLEMNEVLAKYDAPLKIIKSKYECTQLEDPKRAFMVYDAWARARDKKKVFFDEDKVRLGSDLYPDDFANGEPIVVQLTRYVEGCITEEWTDRILVTASSPPTQVWRGIDLLIDKDGRIYSLANSLCSNRIGCSTLAITSDFQLVISFQTSLNSVSSGLSVPSGSGSADWTDLNNCKTLKTFLTVAAERELKEECGLDDEEAPKIWSNQIGYARLVRRGGKPDFYAVSFINVPFSRIKISEKEKKLVGKHAQYDVGPNCEKLLTVIDKLLNTDELKLSLPLYLNLVFLKNYYETQSELFHAQLDQFHRGINYVPQAKYED